MTSVHNFYNKPKTVREHSKKFLKLGVILIGKYSFSNTVVDRWNLLTQEDVDVPSLNCFKSRLDKLRSIKMGFFMDYSAGPLA